MFKITHHDDGKEKQYSHVVKFDDKDRGFIDECCFGQGESTEEALNDFKKRYKEMLKEYNDFYFYLMNNDIEIIEVDGMNKHLYKGKR